jgi:hypothetical protein
MKTDTIGGPRTKREWVALHGQGPALLVLVWASWPPSLTSCAPDASRDKILMPKKSQVNLIPGRSLNVKIRKIRFERACAPMCGFGN